MPSGEVIEQFPWEERARTELGETREIREMAMTDFREKVKEITEFKPCLSERFLLAFLRARKFNVERAVKSYRRFFKIRLLNPKKYFPMGMGSLEHKPAVDLGVGGILTKRNPVDGTVTIIWRVGNWTPESGYDLSDIFTPTAIALLHFMNDDSVMVCGVRFILDLKGLHMGHLRCFPLSALKALIYAITDAFPARFKGFHIMNNFALCDYLYAMCKFFLSKKVKQRLHFHGANMDDLHQYIDPSVLPEEYGGTDGPFSWEEMAEVALYSKHEEIQKFSYFGYDSPSK